MSHVSFGIPLMLGWSSKNSSQRCKMTGSLWEKTSFHNPIAMSIGKVLWPVSASKPNLYVQRYKSLKVCLFFTSFNKSGNLDWIPLIESDFRALHPLTNSSLLNLHIVSAWNFQASTKTVKSSGATSRSRQKFSTPSANMASSSASLYCSNNAWILVSETSRDMKDKRLLSPLLCFLIGGSLG